MSGMMLHGLGDCTPELNCGCMAKSPRDVLRERIARALHGNALELDPENCTFCRESIAQADAVIAALGLRQIRNVVDFDEPHRRYVTPWERIEEDG